MRGLGVAGVIAAAMALNGCGPVTVNDPDLQINTGSDCSPSTCAGCCFNGNCQPGATAAACGSGGGVCVACTANQICLVDQVCGVDPDSVWKIRPLDAVVASTDNGAAWDGDNSAPD